MEDFNVLARTWDNEPRRIERAKIISQEILRMVPGSKERTGMEFGCGTGLLSFYLCHERSYCLKNKFPPKED